MINDIKSKVKLNNGIEIPVLGLGTYSITRQKEVDTAINAAFNEGYRLIDTAASYGNEEQIGKVLKNNSVAREEIFITTKLDNTDHGYENALRAFDISRKKLDTDYIDLYLIHWPVPGKRNDSWKAFEKLFEEKKCRSVGVSNYTISHLEELFKISKVIPAVNQVEFNPFVYQEKLLAFCSKQQIKIEAYTPIARGKRFSHKVLKEITEKHHKTPAQVMLRWAIQHNTIVIPKSSDKNRIKENAGIFDFNLDDEDMKLMNTLDENLRVSPDPHTSYWV